MNVSFGRGNTALTGPLIGGNCVRQDFTATCQKILSVSVLLSTYRRKNKGRIVVQIVDIKNTILISDWINSSDVIDNKYHKFNLPVDLIMGRSYRLMISTEHCRSGMSVTAHYSMTTKQGHLFIDSKLMQDRELACRFSYDAPEQKGRKAREESPVPIGVSLEGDVSGLVSIVIPHYECIELLPKCLASLSRQTYNSIQVVVIDDGSENSKDVGDLVLSYRFLLPGIEFVSIGENKGASHARNIGAQRAHGEYLFFADADCEFYSRTLEKMVSALLDNPSVGFAYGGFRWGGVVTKPREFDAEVLRHRNYITTMSLMRKDLFTGFDESLKRHQDWDLWLTMSKAGVSGMCVGGVLFETPRRVGSISTNENISLNASKSIIRKKHGI